MKRLFVAFASILIVATTLSAAPMTGPKLGQLGFGTLGGLVGAVLAVIAISEITPQIESWAGSTAVVVGSITVFDGVGAAAGVLAAGKVWNLAGNVPATFLGGFLGGLASAFVEPILYLIGIPEGWTEFFGMALLPVLPAVGATWGFDL